MFRFVLLSALVLLVSGLKATDWTIRIELVAPGTRSEGKRGVLQYKNEAIPPSASSIITQNGIEYFYVEPRYLWSDSGWKVQNASEKPASVEVSVSTSDLETGYYYSSLKQLRCNTPDNWVFLKNNIYEVWIAPDKISLLLGVSEKTMPFEFIAGSPVPVLWTLQLYVSTVLENKTDSLLLSGLLPGENIQSFFEVQKKDGTIIRSWKSPPGFSETSLYPSFTISHGKLYYFSGSMDRGEFLIHDIAENRNIFSRKIYFTHRSPVIIHNNRILLAYSEADHRFCHLESMDLSGKTIWHFRSRESICELAPVTDQDRIFFFTGSTVFCFSDRF